MLGIVIVSHGPLAEGFLESSKMLCGENEKIETVLLEETDSPESFYEKLDMAVSRANGEHGLIILADIPGGTPCNQSLLFQSRRQNVEILTGANLPIVLEAILMRQHKALPELIQYLIEVGRESIFSPRLEPADNDADGNDAIAELL